MTEVAKWKRRSPRTSRKSEKPDFYPMVIDEADKLDFMAAADVNGIDDEILLLRVKIKSVLEKALENIGLIIQVTNTLAGLVKTRYGNTREQQQGLKEAIGNVLRDVALLLGISLGTKALDE